MASYLCILPDPLILMCTGIGIYWVSRPDNPCVGRTEDCAVCTCNSCSWWSSDGTQSACNWRLSSQLLVWCCELLVLLTASALVMCDLSSVAHTVLLFSLLPIICWYLQFRVGSARVCCCWCSIGHSLMYELDAFSPKYQIQLQNMVIIRFNCH